MSTMPPPRRRGNRSLGLALLATLLLACASDDEGLDPQVRAPELGTYGYDALLHTSDSLPPDTLTGQVHITVANEDSIVASWSVPGYAAAALRGTWNVNAYTLPADAPALGGSIIHRVWRQNNSRNLSCVLSYQRIELPADTFTSSNANACTLLHEGDQE